MLQRDRGDHGGPMGTLHQQRPRLCGFDDQAQSFQLEAAVPL